MAPHRAREAGQGIGFALVALGVAVAPMAGGQPFPGGFALLMAVVGILAIAWASGNRTPQLPRQAPGWSQERTFGFFAGAATFWALFLVAGIGAGALSATSASGETPGPGAIVADLRPAGQASHTFHLDPGRYLALGAPPASLGPAWPVPEGARHVEGTAQWNASSGLARLDVVLEARLADGSWLEVGRWVLAPGDGFAADAPANELRLDVRPHPNNPAFQPVDVTATVEFLAPK